TTTVTCDIDLQIWVRTYTRAEEISSSAKTKLGKMREARAGVFQITEPYSTDVSDYGIYNTGTRSKSISVTLTAVFKLK
ncbi:MAG TPA: hypothetical protein PKL34_02770, partial [Candidatus Cloacimonadota bacterium]|nr:hypothetical protein [Candidatus Cloacimonadota bacterium]